MPYQIVKLTMNGGQTKKMKIYWFLWVFFVCYYNFNLSAVEASLHLLRD